MKVTDAECVCTEHIITVGHQPFTEQSMHVTMKGWHVHRLFGKWQIALYTVTCIDCSVNARDHEGMARASIVR